MVKLDPEDLRNYAQRAWDAPARLARQHRARQSVEQKVRLQIALYEATRATRPDWPAEADRRADLSNHMRVRSLLTKAANVGVR